jgi:hypothetical protein
VLGWLAGIRLGAPLLAGHVLWLRSLVLLTLASGAWAVMPRRGRRAELRNRASDDILLPQAAAGGCNR